MNLDFMFIQTAVLRNTDVSAAEPRCPSCPCECVGIFACHVQDRSIGGNGEGRQAGRQAGKWECGELVEVHR